MLLSLLAAAAVATTPPGPAPAAKTPPAPAKTTAAARDDKTIVCTREPAPGSRFTIKRCATVADLRARGLLDRQELQQMQQDRTPGY